MAIADSKRALLYNPYPMKKYITVAISIIAVLLGLATGLGIFSAKYYRMDTSVKPAIKGLLWPNPKEFSSFTTIDQDGKEFGLEQMLGKWSFVFFGYTHCPDICPITLSVMNQVQQRLTEEGKANNIQILFVSVDPERDTPDQLKTYVKYFNPDFIGLGGTEQQINSLSRQIGIAYMKGEKTASGDYVVDHTASVILIDPQGRFVSLFSAPQQVDSTVEQFTAIREFIDSQG